MNNKITITGDIGSGKSTIANEMATLSNFSVVSTGEIQREVATSRGMTTLELLSSGDTSVDDEIDGKVAELGGSPDDLIFDSRLAFNFIPDSFKVYLAVDPEVGAERVLGDERGSEKNIDLKGTMDSNNARMEKEDGVFSNLYGIDLRNMDNYDAVIDTSDLTPKEIAKEIFSDYREWKKDQPVENNLQEDGLAM